MVKYHNSISSFKLKAYLTLLKKILLYGMETHVFFATFINFILGEIIASWPSLSKPVLFTVTLHILIHCISGQALGIMCYVDSYFAKEQTGTRS